MRQPDGWEVPQVRWGSREAQRLRQRDRTPPRELHLSELWDCGRPRDDDSATWAEAWRRAFARMVELHGEPPTMPPLAACYDATDDLFEPCTPEEHAASEAAEARRRERAAAKAARDAERRLEAAERLRQFREQQAAERKRAAAERKAQRQAAREAARAEKQQARAERKAEQYRLTVALRAERKAARMAGHPSV